MIEKTDDNKKVDLLHSAAVKYDKLLTIGYHIILGRKGREYHIQLRFPYDSFFHLIGLQHLTDLAYPSKNKERIEYLDYLESMLEEPMILYLFLVKESTPQTCNECKGSSFFKKHEIDFRRGASRTMVLLVEKY